MSTIREIIGLVEKKMRDEFVSVTIQSCWVELRRTDDGKYGINITAKISDVKYEFDEKHERYTLHNQIKALDDWYYLEYETDLDINTELNEVNIGEVVWWACMEFKNAHRND